MQPLTACDDNFLLWISVEVFHEEVVHDVERIVGDLHGPGIARRVFWHAVNQDSRALPLPGWSFGCAPVEWRNHQLRFSISVHIPPADPVERGLFPDGGQLPIASRRASPPSDPLKRAAAGSIRGLPIRSHGQIYHAVAVAIVRRDAHVVLLRAAFQNDVLLPGW